MTQNRYYSNVANVTNLTNSGGINAVSTNLQVQATTGFPSQFPFVLRIEPGTLNEECVLVASGAGTSGSPYVVTRGYDGTTARVHAAGVVVKHGFLQLDFAEPQVHLNLSGVGSGAHGLPDVAFYNTVIGEQTLGSNASTVTFNSIPNNFKALRILISSIASTATLYNEIYAQFNGDTATHYSTGYINMADSTTVQGQHESNDTGVFVGFAWGGSATTHPGQCVADIVNYQSTTFSKLVTFQSMASDASNTRYAPTFGGSTWSGTAAISSITFTMNGTSFLAGSFFGLYGVV